MYKIRVKFTKNGMLKYISHLDTMRMLRRNFQKAGIPVSMSQGFNPHPKFSLAQPLSIGLESYGEYFDLELDEKIDCDIFKSTLNEVLPIQVRIVKAEYIEQNEKPAMSLIMWAKYGIQIKYKLEKEDIENKIESFLAQEEIIIRQTRKKKGKWQTKLKNIRPGIVNVKYRYCEEGITLIEVMLNTGSKDNIRIDDFINAFGQFHNIEKENMQGIRFEMYRDKNGEAIPLI